MNEIELFNKYEEAIKLCKIDYELFPEDNEHLLTAISALEKQIPKKVKTVRWLTSTCPTCGTSLSKSLKDGYYKHLTDLEICPNVNCCQKLDWSEDEGE